MKGAAVVLTAVLAVAGTACNKSNDTAPSVAPTTAPSAVAASPPVVTPAVSGNINSTDALADGQNIGYVKSVDTTKHTISFDLAQFKSPCGHEDYCVVNQNPRLRTVPYSRAMTTVDLVDNTNEDGTDRTVDATSWTSLFGPNASKSPHYGRASAPYWLMIKDGTVQGVRQQFVA